MCIYLSSPCRIFASSTSTPQTTPSLYTWKSGWLNKNNIAAERVNFLDGKLPNAEQTEQTYEEQVLIWCLIFKIIFTIHNSNTDYMR